MNVRISNWAILGMLILLGLLMVALVNGCHKSKKDQANVQNLVTLVDSMKAINHDAIAAWRQSEQSFKDSLEFERGQRLLEEAQKERAEDDLNKALGDNERLIAKYKAAQYVDTTTVAAPREFIEDCHDCFTKLSLTNNLSLKYKKEVIEWGLRYDMETGILKDWNTQLKAERDIYYNKVDSFTNAQGKAVEKVKQKGRLYLSWGVLWRPWPNAAGAGLMYQNKYNLIWGAKVYYGAVGTQVETTINFPLSLKFR